MSRKYIYVGLNNDLDRSIGEHNKGENRSTKAYRPFELILKEKFLTRDEARRREVYFKSSIGKEFLKKLLK